MSNWKSTLPRFWQLKGLSDVPETLENVYNFCIGLFPEKEQEFYLHIPEIQARDAEGRPKYPEQEVWINKIFATQTINAKYIWWSLWQFASMDDAIAFEKLLWKFGAMRLWRLQQHSKEPGVLIEYFFFTVTPTDAGTFMLSVESMPQLPALDKRALLLVRNVLSKNRILAHKKRNQKKWGFSTFNDVAQFENVLQKMLSRYKTRVFIDTGLF
jgi:hypothetical protein